MEFRVVFGERVINIFNHKSEEIKVITFFLIKHYLNFELISLLMIEALNISF